MVISVPSVEKSGERREKKRKKINLLQQAFITDFHHYTDRLWGKSSARLHSPNPPLLVAFFSFDMSSPSSALSTHHSFVCEFSMFWNFWNGISDAAFLARALKNGMFAKKKIVASFCSLRWMEYKSHFVLSITLLNWQWRMSVGARLEMFRDSEMSTILVCRWSSGRE